MLPEKLYVLELALPDASLGLAALGQQEGGGATPS